MPKKNKKKTYNFGHPRNKKKNKNKPFPQPQVEGDGAKKDEEERTRVNDEEDQDEGNSSSDTASGDEKSSVDDRNVEPAKSAPSRNEPPHVGDSAAKFKQVEIPGKGQGLIATARLPVGTIVIQECPIFTVKKSLIFGLDVMGEEIVAKFRGLTDEQKDQVLSLHDPGPTSFQGKNLPFTFTHETENKVARIFHSNSIDLCGHQEMNINKSGLYMTISSINHSCAPNVAWSWINGDKSRRVKQVRVCREIKEGEEILASYIESGKSFPCKDERQKLLRKWNFICNCEICSLTGDALIENEKVRKKISYLHHAVVVNANSGSIHQALEAAKEKLKTMKTIKKEMILQLPAALMECCEMAAHCKIPSSSTAELEKKAKEMSEHFGDCYVHNYMEMKKRMERVTDDDCLIM